MRAWALASPNEYALIYGTPVPGYVAPPATIAPAGRVSNVLLGIAPDRTAPGPESPDGSWSPPETETTTAAQAIENSASHTAKKVSSCPGRQG